MKYLILKTTEVNGEREYTHIELLTVNDDVTDFDEVANNAVKENVEPDAEEEDGGYYSRGGEYHYSVFSIKEITEEEFQVMQKYI